MRKKKKSYTIWNHKYIYLFHKYMKNTQFPACYTTYTNHTLLNSITPLLLSDDL